MSKEMKPIVTLSNSNYSAGEGIPEEVSRQALDSDFVDSFFSEKRENEDNSTVYHHELVDIYSTVVG